MDTPEPAMRMPDNKMLQDHASSMPAAAAVALSQQTVQIESPVHTWASTPTSHGAAEDRAT